MLPRPGWGGESIDRVPTASLAHSFFKPRCALLAWLWLRVAILDDERVQSGYYYFLLSTSVSRCSTCLCTRMQLDYTLLHLQKRQVAPWSQTGRGVAAQSSVLQQFFLKKRLCGQRKDSSKFSNKDIKRDHDPTASLVHSLRNFAAAVLYLKRAQLHRGRKQGGVSQSSVCNVDESEMHNFFNENMVSFQNKNSYKGLCRAGKG